MFTTTITLISVSFLFTLRIIFGYYDNYNNSICYLLFWICKIKLLLKYQWWFHSSIFKSKTCPPNNVFYIVEMYSRKYVPQTFPYKFSCSFWYADFSEPITKRINKYEIVIKTRFKRNENEFVNVHYF